MKKDRKAKMFYLSEEDEKRLKEILEILELPSETETVRQLIREKHKELTENKK